MIQVSGIFIVSSSVPYYGANRFSSGTKHTFYLEAERPTTVKEINKMISLRNVIKKMKLGYDCMGVNVWCGCTHFWGF